MTMQSKACTIFKCVNTGIVGSYPTQGMKSNSQPEKARGPNLNLLFYLIH